MTELTLPEPTVLHGPSWRGLAELTLGAAYWAAFVLALEPGNLLRAAAVGHPLGLEREAARMLAASLLGAPTAPLVLALTRRFPIEGPAWRRRLAIHAASVVGLAGALIPISCLLAAITAATARIGDTDVVEEFADNGLLLAFCLSGFVAIAHALHFRRRDLVLKSQALETAPDVLTQIPVRSRGGVVIVGLDEVDWIEAQGNYLALHVGGAVHLIRETSAYLETRLDPARFARIHRGTLVALDRIRELKLLGGGDAELRLADGTRLRLSRSYRSQVQGRLEGSGPRA